MTSYRAVVLGGTGAVGSSLVRELLLSPRCESVLLLVRKQTDLFSTHSGNGKIQQRIVEMENLERETTQAAIGYEVAFSTLGVGQPRKIHKEEFWKVDVEYNRAFAKGCLKAGIRHASLLSAVGSNENSPTYYIRVKGSAEKALTDLGFPRLSLFRPSLLVTKSLRYGFQDLVTQAVFPKISWMLPSKYHEISVENLGRAMRLNAETPGQEGVEILHFKEFRRLLNATPSDFLTTSAT